MTTYDHGEPKLAVADLSTLLCLPAAGAGAASGEAWRGRPEDPCRFARPR